MSIADIIPAVRELSRGEKFQLAQLLLEDLASQEVPEMFKKGHAYPIYTPEYAPNAASQLARLVGEEETQPDLAWQSLKNRIQKRPIHAAEKHFTRDELHERR